MAIKNPLPLKRFFRFIILYSVFLLFSLVRWLIIFQLFSRQERDLKQINYINKALIEPEVNSSHTLEKVHHLKIQ